MINQREQYLKKAYSYEAWKDINKMNEYLFIRNFLIVNDHVLAWRKQQMRRFRLEDGKKYMKSIWVHDEEGHNTVLRLDIMECQSRNEAHQQMIGMLGNYQIPMELQIHLQDIGDVSFAAPGKNSIIFARANLLIMVSNAGQKTCPMEETAIHLDQGIKYKPKTSEVEPSMELLKFNTLTDGIQESILFEVDSVKQDSVYKIFSKTGDLYLDQSSLRFQPKTAGTQKIELFTILREGKIKYQEIVQ